MRPEEPDTICAIATAAGPGAIGIVRLSGPDALRIADQIFTASDGTGLAKVPSHRLKLGWIKDGERTIDQALVAVMRAPHSYTCEDVVEFQCHGGPAALRSVLELLITCGARLARPGEFTRRAFVNGRIDLTQAEAVLEVIQSRTRAGLRAATARLTGALGRRIRGMRDGLIQASALLEAAIEFPEDELGDLQPELERVTRQTDERISELLASADAGLLYRHGLRVVLAGKPNVGKSSLFNRLLREARAIVTEEPGTTRDLIEETINLQGVPIRLIDSAGLRQPSGRPEQAGVERARDAIAQADLVLFVLDSSSAWDEHDELAARDVLRTSRPLMVVRNKRDLPSRIEPPAGVLPAGVASVRVSALGGQGIDELEQAMADRLLGTGLPPPEDALVTSVREADCLQRCQTHLRAFEAALHSGVSLEAAALDLRAAHQALGDLLGEVTSEDLLDRIFDQFCIGK